MKKVTINDIAKALNISSISVSRALSNKEGVSCDLKQKIIEKAKEMGYLKSNENKLNILVLHQKPYEKDNSNFSYMVQGIEDALQSLKAEYSIEYISKEKQINKYLPGKVSGGVFFNGIIFIGRFNYDYADFLKEKIKSEVFYLGYSPSTENNFVYYNHGNTAYKACQYLIKNGHKKIGFIGGNDIYKSKEFILGISSALEDNSLTLNEEFVIKSRDNLKEDVDKLLDKKERPSAIICSLDYTAIKLLQMLHEKNIKVPEDISVIGCGNTEMSALSIPALTTFNYDISYACSLTAKLLIKKIINPNSPMESISINSTLIERNSVKNLNGRSYEKE